MQSRGTRGSMTKASKRALGPQQRPCGPRPALRAPGKRPWQLPPTTKGGAACPFMAHPAIVSCSLALARVRVQPPGRDRRPDAPVNLPLSLQAQHSRHGRALPDRMRRHRGPSPGRGWHQRQAEAQEPRAAALGSLPLQLLGPRRTPFPPVSSPEAKRLVRRQKSCLRALQICQGGSNEALTSCIMPSLEVNKSLASMCLAALMLLCSGFGSQLKVPSMKRDSTNGRTAFDSPTGTLGSPGVSTTTSPTGAALSITPLTFSPKFLVMSTTHHGASDRERRTVV